MEADDKKCERLNQAIRDLFDVKKYTFGPLEGQMVGAGEAIGNAQSIVIITAKEYLKKGKLPPEDFLEFLSIAHDSSHIIRHLSRFAGLPGYVSRVDVQSLAACSRIMKNEIIPTLFKIKQKYASDDNIEAGLDEAYTLMKQFHAAFEVTVGKELGGKIHNM